MILYSKVKNKLLYKKRDKNFIKNKNKKRWVVKSRNFQKKTIKI